MKINGKDYPTVVDAQGVERFVANPIIRDLLDFSSERSHDPALSGLIIDGRKQTRYDLNEIWLQHGCGRYTLEQMHELYRLIGYSVCGFGDSFEAPATLLGDENPEEFKLDDPDEEDVPHE